MSKSTFVDLVRARADAEPASRALAFVTNDGQRTEEISRADLDRRARAVAELIRQSGLDGARILISLPPGIDYVAAFLGCLYAGAVAVPLYPPPRARHSARHAGVLASAQVAAVLCADGSAIMRYFDGEPRPRLLRVDGELPDPDGWRRPDLTPDTLCFLQYTSGSTAAPCGVMITHKNLLANSEQIRQAFGSGPDTVAVSWLPPYHDMGLIGGILQPLYAGCATTLFSPAAFASRPRLWLELMSRERAMVSGGPNFCYDFCVDRIGSDDLDGLDLSHWEIAFNGAEPVRAATMDRFAAHFGPAGFRRSAFLPCYGLAESTLLVSCTQLGGAARFAADSLAPGELVRTDDRGATVVSCGPVASGTDVVIADPDGMPVPEGVVGEICVAGESVAAGYWQHPSDTVFGHRMPHDPRPYLRTGDLGFLLNGELHVAGRAKELIIVRGRNHYPADLEASALIAHRAICGMVAAFPASTDGVASEQAVVVVEVARGMAPAELPGVADAVVAALAVDHGLTPGAVVLVRVGHVPRTSSGKVQRDRCRTLYEAGELPVMYAWAPGNSSAQPVLIESAPPEDERLRVAVLEAMTRRLGRPADPDQPIVAQGVDSLTLLELRAEVLIATGLSVSLDEVFAGAAIAELRAEPVELPAPVGGEPSGRLPLTSGQRAQWFFEQQTPGTSAQHIYVAVRLLQPVDAGALNRAFQALTDRHPALRTAVRADSNEPYQVVIKDCAVDFTIEDATGLDQASLDRRVDQLVNLPFDLAAGGLFRATLLRHGDGDVLTLTLHHIVADMWSLAILADEIGVLYARERGASAVLAPLPGDYGDLVRQRAALADPATTGAAWQYWSAELAGCTPVLDLPTDRPRPRTPSVRGNTVTFELSPATTAALRGIAAEYRATLFTVLLTVFQSMIYRYTLQPDFLIGVPASGRTDPLSGNAVGYFVNAVLIRSRLSAGMTFDEHLQQSKQSVAGAMRHQNLPFPAVVEGMDLTRDRAYSPGYQVMFSLTNPHLRRDDGLGALQTGRAGAQAGLGDLRVVSMQTTRRTAQVDLTVVVAEVGDRLEGLMNYSTDLFDRESIVRFAEHFELLAAALAADPHATATDIDIRTAAERVALRQWNDTATDYPRDANLADLFAAQVAGDPDARALSYGDLTLSYGQLDRASTRLARALVRAGVRPGDRVAFDADRDPAVIVAMLGIIKAQAAYLPLDPGQPTARRAQIVAEAGPALLLSRTADSAPLGLPTIELGEYLDGAAGPSEDDGDLVTRAPASPLDVAYVMYTSGSSGTPKGICVTHRGVVRLVLGTNYGRFGPGERFAQISNAAFDAVTLEVWGALLTGGELIGFERDVVLSPAALASAIQERRIDSMVVATALFHQLAAHDPGIFAGLRQLFVGGDVMDPKAAAAVAAIGGPKLVNGYGPTESTTFATAQVITEAGAVSDAGRLPVGPPIANTTVYVLDAGLRPQLTGVPGELYIGGDGLAQGYLNAPGQTAAKFVPDPFAGTPGARMYATGDLGRWRADGIIDFLGRADFQVKIRGFRIELAEIDAHVLAYPGVTEVLTCVAGDLAEAKRLVCYYAAAVGDAPSASQMQAFLRERLPDYMVPSILVPLPELPKSANRKLDRAQLPLPEPEGMPDLGEAPATSIEEEVSRLVAELLQLPRLSSGDNFFDIGGHSLLAMRLLARITEQYGVDLPLADFFDDPTVGGIASYILNNSVPGERLAAPGPQRLPRVARTPVASL